MNKNHTVTIRQQVDKLAALSTKLHGIAECLDAISDRYEPGDDIGFVAESTNNIATDLIAVAGALEDSLWDEPVSGKRSA